MLSHALHAIAKQYKIKMMTPQAQTNEQL